MIIDFSVKNFRSFREEQTISFVASNYDKDLPQNLIDPQLPGLEGMKLLKALGIYGANAAGKSNLLHALGFLEQFVSHSATKLNEGDKTGVDPFALSIETINEPSEFVLRFVVEGVRYHFALIVSPMRVLLEKLSAFPEGVERVYYERSWDESSESYEWEPKRPTGFKRDPKLVDYTRSNALFLSTAAKWNSQEVAPIYRWFREHLGFFRVNLDFAMSTEGTVRYLRSGKPQSDAVIRALKSADLGLTSVSAREREITAKDFPARMAPLIVERLFAEDRIMEIHFGHRGDEGDNYHLPWEDESSGTQKFFTLIGPWLTVLETGSVACVDEIESSMHPLMVFELLKLVFDPTVNRKNAQILFTTHNPLLLDPTLLRRDQIWFADKDDEGGTHLYPLTDYKPRKGESLVRGYLAGRYGGIPFIPDGLLGKEATHGG